MTIIAAVQMISTPSVTENIATARQWIQSAAEQGAKLVLLPEYWAVLGLQDTDKLAIAEPFGIGPIQDFMRDIAQQHQLWIIGGTLPLQSTETGKVFNATLVYNPQGECIAQYNKMHLFSFSNGAESYDESRTLLGGNSVNSFETPFGRVGLSVCYDLRFPELYRALGNCTLLVVPAAFIYTTGQAHWEILLRARAIENQCYVLAAGQGGQHLNGRRTWGHSMLIDPWGEIVAVLPEGEGIVVGTLDLQRLSDIRQQLPALLHRKL
jgi:nitrilase